MGRGGGARDISLPVCSTKEEILKEIIAIFFTNGNSVLGDACAMKFELGNFKCKEIKDEDFTLARYITQHKLSKVRIYLLSKLEEGNERVSLSDSEDELPSTFELPPAFYSSDHECIQHYSWIIARKKQTTGTARCRIQRILIARPANGDRKRTGNGTIQR
jgi:hypothetical protein